MRMYPLDQALKAQQALRAATGQGPELFLSGPSSG